MGDASRFRKFARFVADRYEPSIRIADVAGGKGKLRAELYLLGFNNVVTIDKRKHLVGRRGKAYRYFHWQHEPDAYDLVLGMHPDQASDHIVLFSAFRKVDAVLCPCCVMPSAAEYGGRRANYRDWVDHLKNLRRSELDVEHTSIDIHGRNEVLVLRSKR